MLTLYEQKYKQEVDKFGVEQIGRRRRDDYTDGTVRLTVPSTNPKKLGVNYGNNISDLYKFQSRNFEGCTQLYSIIRKHI